MSQYTDYIVMYRLCMLLALLEAESHWEDLYEVTKCIMDVQALGTRCMSAEATERPKFDEILRLVDDLDVDQ